MDKSSILFWGQIRVDMVKSGQLRANMPKIRVIKPKYSQI